MGGVFALDFTNHSAVENSGLSLGLWIGSELSLGGGEVTGGDLTLFSGGGGGHGWNARWHWELRQPLDNGLHYTGIEKLYLGIANWFFGLGSFAMGDWVGASIFAGLGILARSMFIANGRTWESNAIGIVGLSAELLIITLGTAQPFFFDRRVSRRAGTISSTSPINGITITPVTAQNGNLGMGLFYTKSF